MSSETYKCYFSPKDKFRGRCPVSECHANIVKTEIHPSGCIFVQYPEASIDVNNICLSTGLSYKQVKTATDLGILNIRRVKVLQDILTRLRRGNSTGFFCKKCGKKLINPTDSGSCINTARCDHRCKIISEIRTLGIFTLQDTIVNKKDFYLLAGNKALIASTLRKTFEVKEGQSMSTQTFLGLTDEEFGKLTSLIET